MHCNLLNARCIELCSNCCFYSLIVTMLLHACAWLANYLNPVANIIVDTLHQGCRGIFLLADHSHVITRYGLPLVKNLYKLMDCYSRFHCLSIDKIIYYSHNIVQCPLYCLYFIQKLKLIMPR